MKKVKYGFAFDEQMNIVDIRDLSSEQRGKYTCIGCGEPMKANFCKLKANYFSHSKISCNSETYLHRLAKLSFKQKFLESSSFPIVYNKRVYCSRKRDCPFFDEEKCVASAPESYDLKKFYDTCFEEVRIESENGECYQADLLLSDSRGKYSENILLEIEVTHRCPIPKVNSGNKIIEIKIKDETDIESILMDGLVESDTIRFYGFKREAKFLKQLSAKHLFRFYLFASGKAFVSNFEDMPLCSQGRMNRKAILELNMDMDYLGPGPTVYDYGYAYAVKNGYDVKNCYLCKFKRVDNGMFALSPILCCLYKKYNLHRNPDTTAARTCPYYQFDRMNVEDNYRKLMEKGVQKVV